MTMAVGALVILPSSAEIKTYYPWDMQHSLNEDYRTCSQCGSDCEPDPFPTGKGIRIAFVCAQCGLHSLIDGE